MKMRMYYVSLPFLIIANFVQCDDSKEAAMGQYDQQSASLTKKIFKNYNHLVRPCGANSNETDCTPVLVTANIKILSITSIDDDKMNFNVQFLLRQTWNDQRLQHQGKGDLVLDTGGREYNVWTPDTFFFQDKDTYKPLSAQAASQYQIGPNGDVFYTTRTSITLSCPMNLRKYPFDAQYCGLQFGSYAQTKDHVVYKWDNSRAVELDADLRHTTPLFTLGDVTKKGCEQFWVTGTYSCLKAEIQFKRQFGFGVFMKEFVPSFLLVVLSWLSFWLGTDTIGIRALLGAGCLQFLLIHWSILSLNLPHVAGCRTIDLWFIGCIIFVVLSLLHLILVSRCPAKTHVRAYEMIPLERISEESAVQPKHSKARPPSDIEPPKRDPARRTSVIKVQRKYTRVAASAPTAGTIQETAVPMMPTSQYYEEPNKTTKKLSMMDRFRNSSGREKADIVARFLFPVLFLIFNIFFWATY